MSRHLPDQILSYLVLYCCHEGPNYGYGLVADIEDISGGNWSPSYGTVYPLIQRMVDDGLLEPRPDHGKDDRKYYGLTDDGRDRLAEIDSCREEEQEAFADLIQGYLNIFEEAYGTDALRELLEEFDR